MKITIAILAFCSLFSTVHAEDQPVLIQAKRMVDVTTGKLIENPSILIQGNEILKIDAKDVTGAKIIDLGDLTLLPGLIDTHTHLTYDSADYRLDLGKQPGAATAGRALLGAKFAKITLLSGFTTVRDLGACCFSDISLMRAIEKEIIDGPDIYPSGYIITITGGGCDQTVVNPEIRKGGPEEGIADSNDTIVLAVRSQVKYGARVIKTCAGSFTEKELALMADTARRMKVKLAVHVADEQSLKNAVLAGADSIEHAGYTNDEIISLMIQKGIYLVPTMYTIDTFNMTKLPPKIAKQIQEDTPKWEQSFREAIGKGVKVAFGSDSGQIPHGENAKEFAKMMSYGMSALQAMQSATIHAADLLGVTDRGVIEAGKRADIIAVEENPLENIRTLEDVKFVMKAGKIYKTPASLSSK